LIHFYKREAAAVYAGSLGSYVESVS